MLHNKLSRKLIYPFFYGITTELHIGFRELYSAPTSTPILNMFYFGPLKLTVLYDQRPTLRRPK